jgi:hypothetical protein
MVQPYVLSAGQAISTLNGTVTATDAITLTATTGMPLAAPASNRRAETFHELQYQGYLPRAISLSL